MQVKKANNMTNIIFRCFKTANMPALLTAYRSFVRPLVEYCTQLWSNQSITDIRLVESVQRYFTRRLFERCRLQYTSYCKRLEFLSLATLEKRRIIFDLKFIYKMMNGLVEMNFADFFSFATVRGRRTNSKTIFIKRARLDIRKKSFAFRSVPVWNELPESVVTAGCLTVFCRRLNRVELSKYCVITGNE